MPRSVLALGAFLSALTLAVPAAAGDRIAAAKLDLVLRQRAVTARGSVRVIVRTTYPDAAQSLVVGAGGRTGRTLNGINALVAEIPAASLLALAAAPVVQRISLDRRLEGSLERTGATIGSRWVAENLGVDGAGVGVAIIDSGWCGRTTI